MTDQTIEPSGPLGKLCAALDRACLIAACAALVGVAAVQAWQVFARYVLNDSPSWTEPFALLLMSTTMMLGAALGVRSQRHFGFFLLVEHGRPSTRRLLLSLAHVVTVGIGLMLAVWGAEMLLGSWDYRMAGAPLPQGMTYLPLSLGGALIAVFGIEKMMRHNS